MRALVSHERTLSLLPPLLPQDSRARAACVCRAWRAATAHPVQWEELGFEHCAARVKDATLAGWRCFARVPAPRCARCRWTQTPARASLPLACWPALRGGGCTGVLRLESPRVPPSFPWKRVPLTVEIAQQLAAVCPMLQHAACVLSSSLSRVAAVPTALPGPTLLYLYGWDDGDADLTQLAECLRANAGLTNLVMHGLGVGNAGATQLAECLRVNTTLKSLSLWLNNIGDEGAMQLAECLCVNATLTELAARPAL